MAAFERYINTCPIEQLKLNRTNRKVDEKRGVAKGVRDIAVTIKWGLSQATPLGAIPVAF